MPFLLRHAETEWNRKGIKFGRSDIPLSKAGREAAHAWNRLPFTPSAIFTSPLTRAHETAAIIANRLNAPAPTPVWNLIERDHGDAEALTTRQRDARYHGGHIPGRESDEEVKRRARMFLRYLPDDALAVTHSGVIYSLTGTKPAHLEVVEWQP